PPSCTEASPRPPASATSRVSLLEPSARWPPPTSPPAASTWTTSAWSSTPARPPSTRPTRTAPAGPAGPAPGAWWSPCKPAQASDVRALMREGTRRPARRHRQARLRAAAPESRKPAKPPPATEAGEGADPRWADAQRILLSVDVENVDGLLDHVE